MKVLVTGAGTPLGHSLVNALIADPRVERVVAVGSELPNFVPSPKLHRIRANLRRSRELRRVLFGPVRELGVNAVAHVAIQPGPQVQRVDVDATRELVHLAERHPTLRRIVYRSFADIYRLRPEGGGIISETHPLDLSLPKGVRSRAEADLTVCTRTGMAPSLSIAVLRLAELFAPQCGSQVYDYLLSKVCFRPIGFDPMIQLLSLEDGLRAMVLALFSDAQGVFNIPGADVLPLSRAITLAGRRGIALPGPLLGPLYTARSLLRGTEFRYEANRFRFHYSGVLDGRRAEQVLGYSPSAPIRWGELFGSTVWSAREQDLVREPDWTDPFAPIGTLPPH